MEHTFDEFGSMVFGEKEMQERLPRPVYLRWKKTVANEGTLDRPTADAIAHAMKYWALEKGATHYSHWFQPMTGSTAEKHEAFVEPDDKRLPFTHFSGENLIKGEPDASSFPSGGLRSTFEARGYTYWDVTSPVFIKDYILCIPTIFVSYNGDSLDKKDPLLKSMKAINLAATRMVNLLGEKDVKNCTSMCGLEQEYFLVDKAFYEERMDLQFTGRTLFGAPAPKGQELDDHYQGSISDRVRDFMNDVNDQLWKLGIYAKTEHNETAPGQYELACVYSPTNITVDQNQLVMDIMKRTATKYDMACLLHEKPFAGINGSGKHNNYSLVTDTGANLFSPGDKPAENIRFLVFVCAFIKAVDTYPELLRVGASCVGNDHRLGASEAPPAIISVFLGNYIQDILFDLAKTKKAEKIEQESTADFSHVNGLSYIPHDNTDRNRTSPVAFTGNKFEFRMVGSSMSGAMPNCMLNSILAKALNDMSEELEGIKYLQDVRTKALELCSDIIKKHGRILFTGDGYSDAWVKEAKKRGLPNIRSYIESLEILGKPETIALFKELDVYNERELIARKEIFAEQYVNSIAIEVRTLSQMIKNQLLPAMSDELYEYASIQNETGKHTPNYIKKHIEFVSQTCDTLEEKIEQLEKDMAKVLKETDKIACGKKIYNEICPDMLEIRKLIDEYESIAKKENYPFPTYSQMLFNL